MTARPRLPEADRLLLKSDLRALIARVGGLKIAAHETGVSQAYLSKCAAPHHPDLPNVETAALLERAGREALLSKTMADIARRGLGDAPAPLSMSDCAVLAQESGEAIALAAAALVDGQVCAAERRALMAALDDLTRAARAAKRKLAAG